MNALTPGRAADPITLRTHVGLPSARSARKTKVLDIFGIGIDAAAETPIAPRGNPDRVRSEAQFSELAGVLCTTGADKTSGQRYVNQSVPPPVFWSSLSVVFS